MEQIQSYFSVERLQCTIGAAFSVACLLVSAYFLGNQPTAFQKGMAWTALPLSLLLLGICVGVVFRTPSDIRRVTQFAQNEPVKLKTEELPRMEKVMKSFIIIKVVELVLVAVGVLLALFFWKNELLRGISVSLMVLGLGLYFFDLMAEARGKVYVGFLRAR